MKLIYTFMILALCGCTTFSKRDCEQMNWAQRGSTAAMSGQQLSEPLNYYKQTCEKDNEVVPDYEGLKQGYVAGLASFCTEGNLRTFGMSGGIYQNTCPTTAAKAVSKYAEGRGQFVESEYYRLSQENQTLREENDRLRLHVSSLESDNSRLRSESSSLESENSRLHGDLGSCRH